MKSKLIRALIACVIVAAIGFGGYYSYNKFFVKKTVTAAVRYYATSVRTMNLTVNVQGTGSAYAATTKNVTPNNNGTISGLNVNIGSTVTAGQALFTVSSSTLQSNVTNAENNLEKAQLTLSSDEAAQKVDTNKVAMDKLAVSDAQAQLDDANTQLADMTVKAPISGVVTAVNNADGDNIQPGTTVLTIVDMNSLRIKMSVDELDIDKLKVGQSASIQFDAISGKTFTGKVETIAVTGTTTNNVTTYDVDVSINNPSGIRLGMNGNITVAVQSKQNALVIPAEALIETNGRDFVRTENTDSSSSGQTGNGNNAITTDGGQLVPITIGLQTQNYIEVTSGLTQGEQVLVQLPQTSTTTNGNSNKRSFGGGMSGFGGGGFGGGMGGFGGGGYRNGGGRNSGSQGGGN